jgi:hypothetical protein
VDIKDIVLHKRTHQRPSYHYTNTVKTSTAGLKVRMAEVVRRPHPVADPRGSLDLQLPREQLAFDDLTRARRKVRVRRNGNWTSRGLR